MAPAKSLLGTSMGVEHIISQIKIQAMITTTPKDAGKHYLVMQQKRKKGEWMHSAASYRNAEEITEWFNQ